ncbi:hypothetical protein GCM10009635_59810 [Actinocatenispora thailandica]
MGREVYRRTDYLVLKNAGLAALVQIDKEPGGELFLRVGSCSVLAAPTELLWIESPTTDVGNATALADVAATHARPGITAYVVHGKFEHVNFILCPAPLRIQVAEVVPPFPPKLLEMAKQAVAFDEDLPPIELKLDAVDLSERATLHPAPVHLLPCRGSRANLDGLVEYLDTRPAQRKDWLLVGCERSAQFYRHFYGDEPVKINICPRDRLTDPSRLTLTKCCLLERGVEIGDGMAVVPWGANLDEVRSALRHLAGLPQPATAVVRKRGSDGSSSG